MFAENTEYEILTPSGWKDFRGITFSGKKVTYELHLSDGNSVRATEKHHFFRNNKKIQLKHLSVGDKLDTDTGQVEIVCIEEHPETEVFDVIEVDDEEHRFFVNGGIVSKNCDEFSFVRPTIAEEFWTSITPTLATGGKAIITSTPNSDEDQFAQIWFSAQDTLDEWGNDVGVGKNGFKAYQASWERHPERDEKWKDQMLAKLGQEKFSREMELKFVSADETLISPLTLPRLSGITPKHTKDKVRWYADFDSSHIYTISLDPSMGTGGDPAAIQIVDATTMEQVGEWTHNKTDIPGQIELIAKIAKFINTVVPASSIYYSIENNSVGEAANVSLQNYGEHNIPGSYMSEKGKRRKGYHTSNTSKNSACSKFKRLVESNKFKIVSKGLVSELKGFVASGGSYKAKNGFHDDLVMATLLNIRMIQDLSLYDDDIATNVNEFNDVVPPMPFFANFW